MQLIDIKRIHWNRIIRTRLDTQFMGEGRRRASARGALVLLFFLSSSFTQHAAVHANSYKFTLDRVVVGVVGVVSTGMHALYRSFHWPCQWVCIRCRENILCFHRGETTDQQPGGGVGG